MVMVFDSICSWLIEGVNKGGEVKEERERRSMSLI